MNTAIRVVAALLLVGLLVGIGVGVYNAGVSQGLAQNVTAVASGAPSVAYGYYPGFVGPHWGWGFGFFGIFFWILGIFLIFGLLRLAFGWGRGGRYGRWGGYGPGGSGSAGNGPAGWGNPGSGDPRQERLDAWHREAHKGTDPGSGPAPSAS